MKRYCDMHSHSNTSDGELFKSELIEKCINDNPEARMTLAITDHNTVWDDIDFYREKYGDQIDLVSGVEISTSYMTEKSRKVEVHIIAVDYDHKNEEFIAAMQENKRDNKATVMKILELLKERENLEPFKNYEEMKQFVLPSTHVGRMAIARKLYLDGSVKSVNEAFDKYFGDHAENPTCYVPKEENYISIEEAVRLVKMADGIPILAHGLSYRLEEDEIRKLIEAFKNAGGVAMETEYALYDEAKRNKLKQYCKEYGLLESAASDFHGKDGDSLHNCFDYEIYEKLLKYKNKETQD